MSFHGVFTRNLGNWLGKSARGIVSVGAADMNVSGFNGTALAPHASVP